MRRRFVTLTSLVFACVLGGSVADAQTIRSPVKNIALKNGESMEFGDVYLISTDCRSLLAGTPGIEIMDGPPGVSVVIKQAMVVPRAHSCAKPISGGKMVITANNVEAYSRSSMVLRVTYKTRDGERQRAHHINVTLFP